MPGPGRAQVSPRSGLVLQCKRGLSQKAKGYCLDWNILAKYNSINNHIPSFIYSDNWYWFSFTCENKTDIVRTTRNQGLTIIIVVVRL